MKERLQKILASAGVCSRRQAEIYIKEGKVSVDGLVVREMGVLADADKQVITFEGNPLSIPEKKIYLLLNKPKGYVTSLRDPQGRPVVTSLLKGVSCRVFPVGRLDLDTEGALLLTNDGMFAERVMHPRYEVHKTYIARVAGRLSKKEVLLLENGIEIEGRKTSPATLQIITAGSPYSKVQIIIHEGRKRQVRKMFAEVGHPVAALKRIAYGGLKLGSLPLGKFRFLTKNELSKIF